MATATNNYMMSDILMMRYIATLSLKRRILAKFFEKHRITKDEFTDWVIKEVL